MLQRLNERIQGAIAWIVIILIAITFTLFGVDYYLQAHHNADIEVEVNGETISKSDYEKHYRRTRQFQDSSKLTLESEQKLRKKVLEDMIVNLVSVQGAKHLGFEVSTPQANAATLRIPQFQEDGHFSAERFQQALSAALFTPDSFIKEVRQGMLLNQQRFAFIGTAFALPEDIDKFVKLYFQTRDYEYLLIPIALFIKNVKVSPQDIQKYYQTHSKEFIDPAKVSVDYIEISLQEIKKHIKISDEELQRYYQENQNNFQNPAQWLVSHILLAVPANATEKVQKNIAQKANQIYKTLLNQPNQFDEFVKTMSDDKLSVMKGGQLPWLVAGQNVFDQSLINLTQPGQISAPIKTKSGYEIFKVIAYKPSVLKPYAQVRSQIQNQLQADLAQEKYAKALEQLADLSYQTPDSLGPVAEQLSLPIKTTEPFSRQGGNSLLTKNPEVIKASFSHDVMGLGNNSEPIQINPESVIVLRINKHILPKEKPLDVVAPQIKQILALQQAKIQVQQLANVFLTGGVEQDKKRFAYPQLQWKKISNAKRDAEHPNQSINELAFSLARPQLQQSRALNNGDFVIVKLIKIKDGQIQNLDKEQQLGLTQQIETGYGMMDYDLYINSLVSEAKIIRH